MKPNPDLFGSYSVKACLSGNILLYFLAIFFYNALETCIDALNLAGNLLVDNEHRGILCYLKIYNIRYLNRFFEDIKRSLHLCGVYIGCVETNYQLRKRNKPCLIPPFYVDLSESLDELQDSEYRYLMKYEKNPLKTDIECFLKALCKIVIKRARSNYTINKQLLSINRIIN